MSDRNDTELLADIQEAILRIQDYIRGYEYDDFVQDTKTQDAVIRNLEVIGEAAKGVSDGLRGRLAQVPWRSMAGLRDRLIHDYFGVNLDIVWEVVAHELPGVAAQLSDGEN